MCVCVCVRARAFMYVCVCVCVNFEQAAPALRSMIGLGLFDFAGSAFLLMCRV